SRVIASVGHPSAASSAETSDSAGTSSILALALPSSSQSKTSGQVLTHSPQAMQRSGSTDAFNLTTSFQYLILHGRDLHGFTLSPQRAGKTKKQRSPHCRRYAHDEDDPQYNLS